jgi:hypothetical protein
VSRARTFTKREIMDAARAAAENGLCARLCPTGEIEFTHDIPRRKMQPATISPEAALEGWLNGSEARGRA